MATNAELWLAFDDTYYHRALSIPLVTCVQFSMFPITWLRYLGFTICGREGRVSNIPDGPEIAYRPTGSTDNEPPVIDPGIYYYVVAGGEAYFGTLGLLSPPM